MLDGLQAGFGAPLGDVLHELRAKGCELVRIDCQVTRDPALAQEVLDAGMIPLVIVRVPEQIADLPPGSLVEVGNEPDLIAEGWQESPAVYWRTAGACIAYAEAEGLMIYLGAVSNLNARGLAFLRGLPWADIPKWVGCSHHWYPDDPRPHASHITHLSLKYPFKRRNTRDQDIAELRGIVGDRPLMLSETGWFDAPDRSQQTVADWYAVEHAFWRKHGYDGAVAYQLNDENPGQPWTPAMGYGFRELDTGAWKPSAAAWFGEAA